MMYPFITENDDTEITHSEMLPDGSVKVYIETPIDGGFKHATCYLPKYEWKDVYGYSYNEIAKYQEFLKSASHLIMEFSKEGGVLGATNF